jgi:tetratricopeptide (TPR) repeat protein
VQVLINYGFVLSFAQEYEASVEQYRKALELESGSAEAHQRLGHLYVDQNRFADAIREYQTAIDLVGTGGRISNYVARLGYIYARTGRRQEALRFADDLKASAARGESGLLGLTQALAMLYTGLGEKDQALTWLETGYQQRDWTLTNLRVTRVFDPLRSEPRFQQLLKNVGLEE